MPLRVCRLPAHPCDGSVSMLRYWRALRAAMPGDGEFVFTEALPLPDGAVRRAGRWQRFWRKRVAYPAAVRALPPADVHHLLDHGFALLFGALPPGARCVATVHDLAPLEEAGELDGAARARFAREMAGLARAARVVVPSAFTAGRVTALLGIPAERIDVVPMGVDPGVFRPGEPARTGRYVMSVGSAAPRKNLEALVPILASAVQALPDLALVRAGDPLPAAVRAALERILPGRVRELGLLGDTELAAHYAGALGLVLPSRLEGFGLPVLEAMACGCPVVCSRASSLPEAGGSAARYFDLAEPAGAARHLVELASPSARAAAVTAGRAHAARFSWSAHAAQLAEVYRRAAR